MTFHAVAMTGRTVLVTGATQGLGRRVAEQLVDQGATVLVHGRDPDRLDALVTALSARKGASGVRALCADLSDLDQVAGLADRLLREETRLDVLINNAVVGGGVDRTRREVNAQGIELRIAVNHLAPRLLNRRLAPLLHGSAPARIVNVASMGQRAVDLDDIGFTDGYEGIEAYCRSKVALIMDTVDLAADWAGTGVTVNAVHPAHLMDTHGVRHTGLTPVTAVDTGMRPTVRLATDPALATVTGRYFDRYTERPAHPQVHDPHARARLARWADERLAAAGLEAA